MVLDLGELGHKEHQGGSIRVWPVLRPVEFWQQLLDFVRFGMLFSVGG